MAYEGIKSIIQTQITSNGQGEITGARLQNVLLAMVNALGGEGSFLKLATGGTVDGPIQINEGLEALDLNNLEGQILIGENGRKSSITGGETVEDNPVQNLIISTGQLILSLLRDLEVTRGIKIGQDYGLHMSALKAHNKQDVLASATTLVSGMAEEGDFYRLTVEQLQDIVDWVDENNNTNLVCQDKSGTYEYFITSVGASTITPVQFIAQARQAIARNESMIVGCDHLMGPITIIGIKSVGTAMERFSNISVDDNGLLIESTNSAETIDLTLPNGLKTKGIRLANDFAIAADGNGVRIGHLAANSEPGQYYMDNYISFLKDEIDNIIHGNLSITGYIYTEGEAEISGDLTVYGAIHNSSDENLKDIKNTIGLTAEQIAGAPAIKYTWKDKKAKELHVGTTAQYWQKILPETVHEGRDGRLTMEYANAAMVSCISLAKEVAALKKEVQELKNIIKGMNS